MDNDHEMPIIVVGKSKGRKRFGVGELWGYRELLYFLTWRDVKVRYKQTIFGATWAIIQPFMLMVVFSIFLGQLAGLRSDGVPYPLFTFSALVPWTLFAQVVGGASNSLVGNSNLISKIYFPRLLLPLASAGSFLVDFIIAMAVLGAMMLYYGVSPNAAILLVPGFAFLALLAGIAVGIWLAAANVTYRDVRYVVPFLLQLWLFASPVAYSGSIVPKRWQTLYALNPMAGVANGFRWALLGVGRPPGQLTLVSVVMTLLVLLGGIAYFRRVERNFADVI